MKLEPVLVLEDGARILIMVLGTDTSGQIGIDPDEHYTEFGQLHDYNQPIEGKPGKRRLTWVWTRTGGVRGEAKTKRDALKRMLESRGYEQVHPNATIPELF